MLQHGLRTPEDQKKALELVHEVSVATAYTTTSPDVKL